MSRSEELHSLRLPVDVWYIVMDMLQLPQPDGNIEENPHERYNGWKPKSVAQRFPHLSNLINLSSTCTWLRGLIVPRIFATVELNNTAKSARSIIAIRQGKFSKCVKSLRYLAVCDPDQQDLPLSDVYPPEVDDVLANMACFDNLQKLVVEFPFDYDTDLFIDYFQDSEFDKDPEAAAMAESENAFRGLMAASFRAIISNYTRYPSSVPFPRSVEINDLNIIMVSTFSTDAFQYFLSQLKTFKLSLIEYDNGAGWQLNTNSIFASFADCLGSLFFNHLASVEEFSLDPRKSGFLGNAGQAYCCNISLRASTMPKLRKLTLSNIFICLELQDFLLRHMESLKSIILRDCFATVENEWVFGERIRWQDLFNALVQGPFTQLTSFEFVRKESQRELLYQNDEHVDPDLVEQIETRLSKIPHAKVFPYGYVDDKYGFGFVHTEANQAAFIRGEDHRSYLDLMAMVHSNAVRDREAPERSGIEKIHCTS
ncbi:hypothetical protein PHISCL_01764 [Aspergillus sclerotialis]|uniref:F-box domain-containing protein n=1 Tax=Aspergillus sclerotialis TaxID=2070753 RepID=A0A3A2ZRX8_9EURO|nr:hypothetical protein PHISCL_01764 [Aspergillus sclerotialis]